MAMKDHEMERSIAAQNRGRLSIAQKQLKTLQWEHEVGRLVMWKVDVSGKLETVCRRQTRPSALAGSWWIDPDLRITGR